MRRFSISFRLSFAFYLFLALVVGIGLFNIYCLNHFNEVSEKLRTRWLPTTRFLGDLENYTSDYRTNEGEALLVAGSDGEGENARQAASLRRDIQAAREGYEKITHDARENALYQEFSNAWSDYLLRSDEVRRRAVAHDGQGAFLYRGASRRAYDLASDLLARLSALTMTEAGAASGLAARTYQQMRLLTLPVMLAGLLTMAAGVLYIRRSLSAPLLRLAENMRRLARQDTDIPIEARNRRDEIGEMARAVGVFRDNAIELALSRQGLVHQASMLEEKLEHERRLAALQRDFIAVTSHEFRTPLMIIDGHAQRLAARRAEPDEADIEARTKTMRAEVARLTGLIDTLINATRLFDGAPELYFHPQALDPAALLRDLCRRFGEIVPQARLEMQIKEEKISLRGDAKLLEQLFSNLLGNAVKYAPARSPIRLSAYCMDGFWIVSVEDEGIGVPAEERERIFERYARGSNAGGTSGTGIGLHLARMIARMHQGSVEAQAAENGGARFTVRLPLTESVFVWRSGGALPALDTVVKDMFM
jgi:signal transduction histidine kinase